MKIMKKVLSWMLIMAMVLCGSSLTDLTTVTANAATLATAPSDGTVSGSPFVKGTADSNSFRIPSMVTLSDGTLVAAADARWNTTYDGGGGDTIVARSSDNGSTWNYTFANYLGDNGNSYSSSGSTCFIDPALAVDSNDKIYMLVDLYPYGVALNGDGGQTSPSTASGFNSDGTLKLSADGSNYNYYLKDGKIYDSSNTEVSGYTVDGKFNISKDGTYVSNLFFSDSPYKVVRTGYLYLTTSTDKGATWSDPTLLPNIKTTSEKVCLVGPGRGTVLSDKTIVFPVYSYNGSDSSQRVGFIYSTDNGSTWNRSDSSISWSSESAIVEVNSSTLRVFYRNGNSKICYVDVTKNGNSYTWGSAVTTSVACNSNTQLSAIKVTSGDTDYILVSCPGNESNQSGASYRTNGQIVTFKASDMSIVATTSVPSVHTSNSFMYSCMSQLSNGNVAILYEDQQNDWGTGDSCYYQMSFKTYALSDLGIAASSETGSQTITDSTENVTVTSKDTAGTYLTSITCTPNTSVNGITTDYVAYDITLNDGKYTDAGEVTIPLSTTLQSAASLTGFVVESDGTIKDIEGEKSTDGKYYTFTSTHFSTVGVRALNSETTEVTSTETIKLKVGETSETYTVSSDTNYGSASATTSDGVVSYVQTGTDKVETTYTVTEATALSAGYIGDGTNYIVVDTSASYASDRIKTTTDISKATKWSLSGQNLYYTYNNTTYYFVICSSTSTSTDWSYVGAMTQTEIDACTNKQNATGWSWDSSKKLNGWGQSNCVVYDSDSQKWVHDASETKNGATIYTSYSETAGSSASTTIKFTGVSAGTTSVVVGSTTYNITVSAATYTEKVSVKVGGSSTLNPTVPTDGSVSYEVTEGSDIVSVASDGTVTATGTGNATVVATVKNSAGNTVAVYTYNLTVSERGGAQDAVSVAIAEDKTLSVELNSGETVVWSSSDSSIAGIVGDDTATATLIGSAAGTATVTGTVKDAAGNVTATYTWDVTVTDSNTTSKYIYINVDTKDHTTVYYAINGGELIKINGTGVLIDEAVTGHYQIAFFAAPDEGYALTYMNSTNSKSQYYCLSDGEETDGTDSSAWPFADSYDWETKGISTTGGDSSVYDTDNGYRWGLAEGNITIAQLRNMYARALALGCDGTLVFTKNNTGTTYDDSTNADNLHSSLTFVSQPLPTLKKTIKTIGGETYTEGTSKVSLGDEIVYNITVTRPATVADYGTITYSNEALYDKMTNGDTTLMSSGTMGTSDTSDKTYSYETKITLSLDNYDDIVKDGKITNTAEFTYSYKSEYSNGTLSAAADVTADQISIDAPSYVIDFSLPVSFNISKSIIGTIDVDKIEDLVTSEYGTVDVDEDEDDENVYKVTYTPKKVLEGIDTIKFTVSEHNYIVLIYPATTMYYEADEDFVTLTENWNLTVAVEGEDSEDAEQHAAVLGNDKYNYGYDPAYATPIQNDTTATSTTKSDLATFTFTGTGVDIYANPNKTSGYVSVIIKDADGNAVKNMVINTASINGDTENLTVYPDGTLYNVPVASVTGLTYGTYTVAYKNIKAGTVKSDGDPESGEVTLDGFKVYNTLADSSVYSGDLEDKPTFIEVRDLNFATVNLTTDSTKYASDIYEQVHSSVTDSQSTTAVITSAAGATVTATADLIDNGPKNEVYLYPGMTLTLKLDTTREAQIGLRGLQSGMTCEIGTTSTDVSTTDMFYTAKANGSTGSVTITNPSTNTGILAVTKLKVCDAPDAVCEITEENIEDTLAVINGTATEEPSEPEVVYADATLTVNVTNQRGQAIGSTTLTYNGEEGEEHTFTKADIQAAVKEICTSNGYQEPSKVNCKDVTVNCGESSSVSYKVNVKAASQKNNNNNKNNNSFSSWFNGFFGFSWR